MNSSIVVELRQRLRDQARRVMHGCNARFDESDLVQEALLTTFRRGTPDLTVGSGDHVQRDERQLLQQTLVDLMRFHVRAQKRSMTREIGRRSDDSANPHCSPEFEDLKTADPALLVERRERLDHAWSAISAEDCNILRWRCIDRLTSGEIATRLGMSEASVSKRYVRALATIRQTFEPLDDDTV